MFKKIISIIIIMSIVLNIGTSVIADDNNVDYNNRDEKDVKFIVKHYDITEEYARNLPDITFNALKGEKPSENSSSTKYFVLTEKQKNKVHFDQSVNSKLNLDIDDNIVAKEVTAEEFENARNKSNDLSSMTSLDPDITKDFGWVKLRTRIFYLLTSDKFWIINETEYLQGSYLTLLPTTMEFVCGIGTNSNMSIVNTSPYFSYQYTIIDLIHGGTYDYSNSKEEADLTNDDGYGFIMALEQGPHIGHTNVDVYSSVLAIPNVSDLTVADAYGHFSRTSTEIDIQSSAGISGANLDISPASKTTEINPIHVQVERN